MISTRHVRLVARLATVALFSLSAGCGNDGGPAAPVWAPLVGTWQIAGGGFGLGAEGPQPGEVCDTLPDIIPNSWEPFVHLFGFWAAPTLDLNFGVTMSENETYTVVIAGEHGDSTAFPGILISDVFCTDPPASSCTKTGTFTATGTQVAFDVGTPHEVVFEWALQGPFLIIKGRECGAILDLAFMASG